MEYTQRKNLNRGYMKLDVWNDAMLLFEKVHANLQRIDRIEIRLEGQILDAAQSISANISEGYCRKSINEYIQFLYYSLGSLGELFTRMLVLKNAGYVAVADFELFDAHHFSVENKLLALIKSLQEKKKAGTWDDQIHEPNAPYSPNP